MLKFWVNKTILFDMKIKYLFLFSLILGYTTVSRKKNNLEKELDNIPENQTKVALKKMNFINFTIDWGNPNIWESNCAYYKVIPKLDTFNNKYWVDFCNEKYQWWDMNKK